MSNTKKIFRYWSFQRQRLGKQGSRIEQVLRDVIGVYSSHPSAPLSLHARVQSFTEQAFYCLDEDSLAYRVPAMRQTVHMLPKETAYFVMAAVLPPPSDPYWQKLYSQRGKITDEKDYTRWTGKIALITNKPLTVKEIKESVDLPDAVVKSVLNRMAFEGRLLRVGAKSLRSNIISYVSTKACTGDHFPQIESDRALVWLAGEYLKAFGPVRIEDFQWWAGISSGKAKKAMTAHETVAVGDDYLLLANDLNDFESFKIPTIDCLDILPRWDCYIMGYAPDGRERFVSSDMQQQIYGKIGATGGNALGVVLVNGEAHGSWDSRFAGSRMTVNLNLFEKPSSQLEQNIRKQFEEIAALLKAKSLIVAKN